MKTLIQKIILEEQRSFACRRYRTPNFETNWHKHEEYELILITEGHGTVMIGDYIGEYQTGDIYFLAGNLPHWFKKQHHKMTGCSLVVHFKKEILGNDFLELPELKMVQQFLKKNDGIQIKPAFKKRLEPIILNIEKHHGFESLQLLLNCLQLLSTTPHYTALTKNFALSNDNIDPAIE